MHETVTIAYAIIALVTWVFTTAWQLGQRVHEPDADDYVIASLFGAVIALLWLVWVFIGILVGVFYLMGRLGGVVGSLWRVSHDH